MTRKRNTTGFTIVELLIVIVVIGILAAITIVAYNGVQKRAAETKIESDINNLVKAVHIARDSEQKAFKDITGSSYTMGGCSSEVAGTNLATLSKSHACWTRYQLALDRISAASGVNVQNIVDPWGRPYRIDENEGESGTCNLDTIAAYANPFNGTSGYLNSSVQIPRSGYSVCAAS